MTIQLLQENNAFNINRKHFLIDEESDLTTLENQYDCSMGDIAELVDGTIYYRHSNNYEGNLWELKESSSGTNKLPTATGNDEGKALRVNSSGNWVVSDLPEELPYVTSEDNGKILKVFNGYWDKVMPSNNILIITPTIIEDEEELITTETWDKTAREIIAAMPNVFVYSENEDEFDGESVISHHYQNIGDTYYSSDEYAFISFSTYDGNHLVRAASLDDYPTITISSK